MRCRAELSMQIAPDMAAKRNLMVASCLSGLFRQADGNSGTCHIQRDAQIV